MFRIIFSSLLIYVFSISVNAIKQQCTTMAKSSIIVDNPTQFPQNLRAFSKFLDVAGCQESGGRNTTPKAFCESNFTDQNFSTGRASIHENGSAFYGRFQMNCQALEQAGCNFCPSKYDENGCPDS